MPTLDQIQLTPQDRAVLQSAAQLLRHAVPIEKVILFGSKARGDDTPDSDIDLLVLTRDPADAALRRRMLDLLYPLELEKNTWFGLTLVSRQDWEHGLYQAMPIRQEIEREGVEV